MRKYTVRGSAGRQTGHGQGTYRPAAAGNWSESESPTSTSGRAPPPARREGRNETTARGNLPDMPDANTRWILGTLAVLGGLLLSQGAATNARIDDLRADIGNLRTDVRRLEDRLDRLDDRLRAVEVAFGKVEQRLETLERVILPAPEPAD